jgi:hypothetical protein
MDGPNTDVIQGTLDMLILKTLSLEPDAWVRYRAPDRADLAWRFQSESVIAPDGTAAKSTG